MNPDFSNWNDISRVLNHQEQIPGEHVWLRIQKKKRKYRLMKTSFLSSAASFLIVCGVFAWYQWKSSAFSGYSFEPPLEKTETESFLASVLFSNTQLSHYGKVEEGNEVKMLMPKIPSWEMNSPKPINH
jgi:hypothetical protein